MAIDIDTLAMCAYAVNDTMRTGNKKTIDKQIQDMIDEYSTNTQAIQAAAVLAAQED